MARQSGPKNDVSLVRATGCFVQSIGRLMDDDSAAQLDEESYDAIMAIEKALDDFEDFMYVKRHDLFFKDRVVMF